MLENGFIKLHRALTEWGWYKDVPTCKLWLHILLRANFRESVYMGKTIPRGGFVTSLQSLADGSGLTVKQVRTALGKLKSTGEITLETNRHFSVIVVVKYEEYQQDTRDQGQTEGTQRANKGHTEGKPRADQGQTEGSQRATEEEGKKARKKESKNNNSLSSPTVQKESRARVNALPPEYEGKFCEPLLSAVRDWLSYKAERRDGYKPTGLRNLLTEITNREQAHGAAAVADVIRLSMAQGWKGIIWDKIAAGKPAAPKQDAPLSDWEREWMDEVKRRQSVENAGT